MRAETLHPSSHLLTVQKYARGKKSYQERKVSSPGWGNIRESHKKEMLALVSLMETQGKETGVVEGGAGIPREIV